MAEQSTTGSTTTNLHDRIDAVAEIRPDAYHFALAFLIGASRVNPDLRDRIESAIDYVERMVNRD